MQAAWLVARAAAADALLHLWVRELVQDRAKPQGEVFGRLCRQVCAAGPRHGLLWGLTTGTASTPANATKLTSQCTRQVLKLLLSNLAALAECARLLSCQ
jgi:hypothetical protein